MIANGTCMKCWGIADSSLSAVTKADAGQKLASNYQTPNILYMMLPPVFISLLDMVKLIS
jgi:hypothetical protein